MDDQDKAAEVLGEALQATHNGTMKSFRRLALRTFSLPWPLTRWERWQVWFWRTIGQRGRAQRIIINAIARGYPNE